MNENQPKYHNSRPVPHIRLDPPRQVLAIPGEAPPVTILVDGSNAAFLTSPKITGRRQAKYDTLAKVQDYLRSLQAEFPGVATEVLVDANLPYHIDDRDSLERDIDAGAVQICPAGAQADAFILEYARYCSGNAIIVSNDLFRGHEVPALEKGQQWRFPLMLIQGQVVVPRLRDEVATRYRFPFQDKAATAPMTTLTAGHP